MSVGTVHTPGTRAVLRHAGFSAYKAREVLNLIRGKAVGDAYAELMLCERGPAEPIAKLLRSAVANAGHNDGLPPEELFVGACFADEGPTMKRFRPRARGRATRIRKRSCHITIIVSRYSIDELEARRESAAQSGRPTQDAATTRARRVAQSRKSKEAEEETSDLSTDEDEVEAVTSEGTVEPESAVESESAGESDAAGEDSADQDAAAEDTPAVQSLVDTSTADSGAEDAASKDAAPGDAGSDDAPYGAGSHAPLPDNAQPDGYPIKGNADSMLYHLPEGSHYGRTIAEVWFATEEDAQKAGFSPTGAAAKKEEG